MPFDSFLQRAQREVHSLDAHCHALWDQRDDHL